MKPIYIFDLDGTLADMSHRVHLAKEKRWREFFAACVDDKPIPAMVETFKRMSRGGAECWIWTGRSDEVRDETTRWLAANGLLHPFWTSWQRCPWGLLMRREGDHQPDDRLKFGWLANLEPPERKRITAVFEDRDRVVKMWRDAGVPCFQVAPGDF